MADTSQVLLNKKMTPRIPIRREIIPLVNTYIPGVENPVTLVEKVLIAKIRLGDSGAFSSIFTAYYKDLVMFAYRFTNEVSSAEEIVQEIFVRLWDDHETIVINISLKSYLLKAVQNKYIDLYRHNKSTQAYSASVLERSYQHGYDTDSHVMFSELQEQIEKALKKLPPELAEAFELNRYSGLKYHEIAKRLGVSIRTVEARIGKALSMLRYHLKGYLSLLIMLICLLS
jgi:RNA polymerase sigma-70 factor, ECF subfamily